MDRVKPRPRWPLLVLVFGVGMGLAVFALSRQGWGHTPAQTTPSSPPSEVVIPVTVEPVKLRSVAREVAVVGSLYGWEEVALTPKVDGRVLRVLHDVGDRVQPGELLAEIDPTDHQLAYNEARRAQDLELARLGVENVPGPAFDIHKVPSVMRAAALERNAVQKLDRQRRLAGSAAATREDRDQAESDHEVARANHEQALLEVRTTLAAIRHRQAMMESAQQKVHDTRLVAPLPSGVPNAAKVTYVITARSLAAGENLRAMSGGMTGPIFRLAIDQPLKLQVTIPERHRAEIQEGQEAELGVEAYPKERFSGKVARINPAIDRTNRTFMAEIHVPNPDRRLSPGSFARATIRTRVDTQALTVPEEAVLRFAGVTKVFVVHEGKAHAVPIVVKTSIPVQETRNTRTWVEVIGDIKLADSVVTSGQTKLAEGTPIRIRDAEARP